MNSFRITVGDRGRLAFPAAVRRECGIRDGEDVIVTVGDDGVITLHPAEVLARQLDTARAALTDREGVRDLQEWREASEARRADHLENPSFDPALSAERGRRALERLDLA